MYIVLNIYTNISNCIIRAYGSHKHIMKIKKKKKNVDAFLKYLKYFIEAEPFGWKHFYCNLILLIPFTI